MPYKDESKQREYQRDWLRRKVAIPENAAKMLQRKREWQDRNREHVAEYNLQWQKTTEKGREYVKRHKANRKSMVREWYRGLKATLTCSNCSENHPATLDFHHVDPSEKGFNISHWIRSGTSIERIKAEIEKCVVLCSNCHRKLHWSEDEFL